MRISYTYQIEVFKGLWFWPALLEILLLRPVRLLSGFALAWAADVSRAQVDSCGPTQLPVAFLLISDDNPSLC